VPDNFSAVISFEATYMDWIAKEATEIQLHAKNFKTEAGFILSHTWQLVMISLPKCSSQPGIDSPAQVQ
jgi:hypothetical protein